MWNSTLFGNLEGVEMEITKYKHSKRIPCMYLTLTQDLNRNENERSHVGRFIHSWKEKNVSREYIHIL